MAYRNSIEERIFILEKSFQGDAPYVQTTFVEKFPGKVPPSRQAIHALKKKFRETGSVHDAKKSGRPVSVRSPQNKETVVQFYHENPGTSQVRASLQVQISRTSLRRIMKDLKLRLWRPRLVHALNEDDFDRRSQFSEWYVNVTEEDPSVEDRILWSDEATFHLNGQVNRHNSVYYAETNPHLLMEGKKIQSPGVCVWAAIRSSGVIGPYFFEDTVSGETYLTMLREFLLPQLQNEDLGEIIFMQDGAPPHFANIVRTFLDKTFTSWIGRRGTTDWPARSPDLTPCDFALWGIVKEAVFSRNPDSLQTLRQYIREEIQKIDMNKQLCQNICHVIKDRCLKCIGEEGKHFEHLM